jgi:hypothetical protein
MALRVSPRKHASTEKRLLNEALKPRTTIRQKNKNMAMLLSAALATEKYEKFELRTVEAPAQIIEAPAQIIEAPAPQAQIIEAPASQEQTIEAPQAQTIEAQTIEELVPMMSAEDAQHIRDLEFLLAMYDQRNGYPYIGDIYAYNGDESDSVRREGLILYELINAATVKACTTQ